MNGFLLSVCANTAFGAGIAHVVGVAPAIGAVALNGVAVASSLVGGIKPADALCAGIYTEVWTGEMVKAFRNAAESLGWYNRIRSYDQYVENDVIHFVNLGGRSERAGEQHDLSAQCSDAGRWRQGGFA